MILWITEETSTLKKVKGMHNMQLTLKPLLMLLLYCPVCRRVSSIDPPCCPYFVYYELWKQRRKSKCPRCSNCAVDKNTDDYYECRVCHTQYCVFPGFRCKPDNADIEFIGYNPVFALPSPRAGSIPIDIAMEKARQEVLEYLRKKRRFPASCVQEMLEIKVESGISYRSANEKWKGRKEELGEIDRLYEQIRILLIRYSI